MYKDDDYEPYGDSQPALRQSHPPSIHSFVNDHSAPLEPSSYSTTRTRITVHHPPLATNTNTSLFDDVELGEQLSSQIEYNNQLLRTIQDMERKSQELNREMEKKNQDLRMLKNEIAQLRSQMDSIEDVSYQKEMEVEDLRSHIQTLEDDLERTNSECRQLSEHVKELRREINEKESRFEQQQQTIISLERDLHHFESVHSSEKDASRQYYQYLGNIQKQLREFAMVGQDLRDKYNHMASKMNTIKMMKQTIQEFETNNTDLYLREITSLQEEKKILTEKNNTNTDRLQLLEVQLEEERAKTIMLEEKTSRLEQQQNELQRRSEKDIEDQVRKTNNQIRILNESMQKLQAQLDEKEKLLGMVQKERSILAEEKGDLEKEYMELLSRSTASAVKKRTTVTVTESTNTNRYSRGRSSELDSSLLASNAHETLKHNEDMEEIHNKTKNLAEKYKEVVSYQQQLQKNLNNK